VLGLLDTRLDVPPTTVYLMTFRDGKCTANCGFCPQARLSGSRADMLSRVSWPTYQTTKVLDRIETACNLSGKLKRICIQALNYAGVFNDLSALVEAIRARSRIPVSASCQPVEEKDIVQLANAGVQRIGIPLDAATEEVFDKVKGYVVGGPYEWKTQLRLLGRATEIFGRGRVSTHLIVGIGETEEQMVSAIQNCVHMGVLPALFAFTPIQGTTLSLNKSPEVSQYRRIQVARQLIVNGIARFEDMKFSRGRLTDFGVSEQTVKSLVETGEPFQTSGCPGCNRPYYNERPEGPIYNYARELTRDETSIAESQLA
jgi:biotin synthase-related radical SAM superfamily protein